MGVLFGAVGALLPTAYARGPHPALTSIGATHDYDVSDVAQVDVHNFGRADARTAQVTSEQVGSASPRVAERGPSTTPPHSFIATEAVRPRFITTGAGTTIDRASVGTAISVQRQGRHLAGGANYNGGGYSTRSMMLRACWTPFTGAPRKCWASPTRATSSFASRE